MTMSSLAHQWIAKISAETLNNCAEGAYIPEPWKSNMSVCRPSVAFDFRQKQNAPMTTVYHELPNERPKRWLFGCHAPKCNGYGDFSENSLFPQVFVYVYECTARHTRSENGPILRKWRWNPCTFTNVQRDILDPEFWQKTCNFWISPMVTGNSLKKYRISHISRAVTSLQLLRRHDITAAFGAARPAGVI